MLLRLWLLQVNQELESWFGNRIRYIISDINLQQKGAKTKTNQGTLLDPNISQHLQTSLKTSINIRSLQREVMAGTEAIETLQHSYIWVKLYQSGFTLVQSHLLLQIKATPPYIITFKGIQSVTPSSQQTRIKKSSKQTVSLEIICSHTFSSPMATLPASDSSLHLWHSQTAPLEYWGSGENPQLRHRQDTALRMETSINFSFVLYKISFRL